MATTVEDFKLRISVEGEGKIKAVSAAMGDFKKDVDGFNQVGGPLGNTINGIVGRLGTMATGALAAAGAFVLLGSKSLQIAGELSDISGATGIATGQIQNFRTSLIAAGGKAEDASLILSKLNQSVQEAAGGNGKLQKAFQDLGVYVTDANGKIRPTGDILQDITEKAQRGEITQKQYAAAVDILGKNINKLELGKLSALRDPVADADIKRLDAYNDAIDRIRDRLSRGIVTFFGSVAEQADKAFAAIDAYEKKRQDAEEELNKKGLTSRGATLPGQPPLSREVGSAFLPDWMQRQMTAEEKAFLAQQKRYAEQEKLMKAYKSRAGVGRDDMGGFGSETPEQQKARLDSEKRFQENIQEIIKNQSLQGANDLQAIEINAANEIAKAKLEIRSKENLSKEDQDREIITKTAAIEQKAALDTAKLRSQQNAKIYSELESQRQKSAEELAAEEKRIDGIVESSIQLTVEQQNQLDAQKRKNELLSMSAGLSDREAKNVQEIFNLEEERLTLLRQIANTKDLPYAERLKREAQINEQIRQRKQLAVENQQIDKAGAENFAAGWSKAYGNFLDNTRNASATAIRLFQKFTGGLEDYFINRLKGMDGGWKKFTQGLLEEIARANLSKVIANVFNPDTGVLGGIGKIFGALTGNGFGASAASAGSSSSNPVYAYITNLGGGDTTGLDMGPQIPNKGPLGGIWDSVKNTASSVFDSVKGVFSDITDTIGSIFSGGGGSGGGFFSGLSDLFGGFFANGGQLGAGKFGIAGENGPELISGPATVTPMGGVTNVTYNINAVDAMSFKAMIAADPGFIHAVAMQGGKSMPRRY